MAKTSKMTEAKLAIQGGRKKRGFWKEESTVEALRQYASGELSMNDTCALLETLPGTVLWYVRERKIAVTRSDAGEGSEAALEHGAETETDVPF